MKTRHSHITPYLTKDGSDMRGMTPGGGVLDVARGDSILIPPGTSHGIEAAGDEALRILCCCSPSPAHDDAELPDTREPAA